jgi:hypothetical protein
LGYEREKIDRLLVSGVVEAPGHGCSDTARAAHGG